ncbi:putative leader peptide [Streptomyces sp. bgisy100]|uniref:putative leader peptide n=1 Tax=Streptomyces sp. bgisy100 TaxID=3413783 RepID=UPI003D71866E
MRGKESAMRDGIQQALTRAVRAAILLYVSQSENFVVRLHVDLRRQASAICAVGR